MAEVKVIVPVDEKELELLDKRFAQPDADKIEGSFLKYLIAEKDSFIVDLIKENVVSTRNTTNVQKVIDKM